MRQSYVCLLESLVLPNNCHCNLRHGAASLSSVSVALPHRQVRNLEFHGLLLGVPPQTLRPLAVQRGSRARHQRRRRRQRWPASWPLPDRKIRSHLAMSDLSVLLGMPSDTARDSARCGDDSHYGAALAPSKILSSSYQPYQSREKTVPIFVVNSMQAPKCRHVPQLALNTQDRTARAETHLPSPRPDCVSIERFCNLLEGRTWVS